MSNALLKQLRKDPGHSHPPRPSGSRANKVKGLQGRMGSPRPLDGGVGKDNLANSSWNVPQPQAAPFPTGQLMPPTQPNGGNP